MSTAAENVSTYSPKDKSKRKSKSKQMESFFVSRPYLLERICRYSNNMSDVCEMRIYKNRNYKTRPRNYWDCEFWNMSIKQKFVTRLYSIQEIDDLINSVRNLFGQNSVAVWDRTAGKKLSGPWRLGGLGNKQQEE
jgi:hypothetical protein